MPCYWWICTRGFARKSHLELRTCLNFQRKFHGKKHPKRTDSETATALSPLCSALLHERVFQAAGPLPLPFPLRLPPVFSPAEHKSHKPNFAFTTYSTYQSVGGTEREREPGHHATRGQERAPSLRGSEVVQPRPSKRLYGNLPCKTKSRLAHAKMCAE